MRRAILYAAVSLMFCLASEGAQGQMAKVSDLYNRADRSLGCESDFKLTMGIGRVVGNLAHPIQFDFEDIKPFLMAERHKELLLITFELSIMGEEHDVVVGYVTKVNKMFKDFGYRRVVILSAAGHGNYILSDTATKPVHQNPSPPKTKRG